MSVSSFFFSFFLISSLALNTVIYTLQENFMMSRKSYEQNPHDIEPAMFLATSYDKASEAWTKQSPSKSVCAFFFSQLTR